MAKTSISRRGKNEGSIFKLPSGKWICQVTSGYDDEGKRIRKSYTGNTRSEVAAKLSALVTQVNTTGYIKTSNDNLETLMLHWLLVYKKAEVASRTFERIMGNTKSHVFSEIGHLKLDEISTDVVQTLFGNLMDKKKLAAESVKKIKYPLNQFFDYAIDNKFIDRNPVTKTIIRAKDRDRLRERNYKALRKEDRMLFLNAVSRHPVFKPLCYTAMFGGLRIGEVLALKWRNINLEKGFIYVENAITQLIDFDSEGNTIDRITVIGDTKTAASERESPIPDILIDALKEYKKRRAIEEKLQDGVSFVEPDDIVFSTYEGKLRTYWGTYTLFTRLLKKYKLDNKGIHFHTLRHTFSNMLFEAGENPKIIQELMGHKDVKTTMIYNSVDKAQISGARGMLNRIVMENIAVE